MTATHSSDRLATEPSELTGCSRGDGRATPASWTPLNFAARSISSRPFDASRLPANYCHRRVSSPIRPATHDQSEGLAGVGPTVTQINEMTHQSA